MDNRWTCTNVAELDIGREEWFPSKYSKSFSSKQLDIVFGYTKRRRVRQKGIRFNNLMYFSEELIELYKKLEIENKDTYVDFKYNPGDITKIYVIDPITKKDYLEVPCIN